MQVKRIIAIVDDEASLRETLSMALSAAGYGVMVFADAETAFATLSGSPPDAIILDVMMPGLDGIAFCRRYRELQPKVPIVFLSAAAEEDARLEALEQGGDDFLPKPCSIRELLTRLRVCFLRMARLEERNQEGAGATSGLRLEQSAGPGSPDAPGRLSIEPEAWEARLGGVPLELTVTEFRLLSALASRPGGTFDRERLAAACYPDDAYVSPRAVDAHVKRLRRKLRVATLGEEGVSPAGMDSGTDIIETVHGIGYRLRAEAVR